MRRTIAAAAVSLLAIVRVSGGAVQKRADIDPNALADALMGFMGAQISDTTDLTDDSEADAEEQRNEMWAAMGGPLAGNKKTQDEDALPPGVIPIAGDSSAPVDEIMDGGEPEFSLVSLLTPPRPQLEGLQRPFIVFTGFHDGITQLRVFSQRGLSVSERARMTKLHLVVAPLSSTGKQNVESWLARVAPRGSGVHVTSLPVRGICVEAAKLPPAPDAMFIPAVRAAQEQFKPARTVRIAGEYATAHGYLRPQGDPVSYGRSVTQYAVWTSVGHWDEARFTAEFLSRARQDMSEAKKPWTSETDKTLRALAPARWRDIKLVVDAADRVDARHRTSRGDQ